MERSSAGELLLSLDGSIDALIALSRSFAFRPWHRRHLQIIGRQTESVLIDLED